MLKPCDQCGATFQKSPQSEKTLCPSCRRGTSKRLATEKRPIGTRYVDGSGYIRIQTETGSKSEHSIIMEEMIGRPLNKGESVHHRNGLRDDNRPENLELWVTNARGYGQRAGQRASELTCGHCGQSYLATNTKMGAQNARSEPKTR